LDILALLPHRDPFLFLDDLLELSESGAVGVKTFRADEAFFSGHFPSFPVVPGVILCEFALQTAAAWMTTREKLEWAPSQGKSLKESLDSSPTSGDLQQPSWEGDKRKKIPVVTRIRDVQFRQVVRPGQRLEAIVRLEDQAANAYWFSAEIRREDTLVARLHFACMLIDANACETWA
jgi:3-hydroxyacyl-[acyl-carrier-protein] dehydratase